MVDLIRMRALTFDESRWGEDGVREIPEELAAAAARELLRAGGVG